MKDTYKSVKYNGLVQTTIIFPYEKTKNDLNEIFDKIKGVIENYCSTYGAALYIDRSRVKKNLTVDSVKCTESVIEDIENNINREIYKIIEISPFSNCYFNIFITDGKEAYVLFSNEKIIGQTIMDSEDYQEKIKKPISIDADELML